jgi:hypothetical protein
VLSLWFGAERQSVANGNSNVLARMAEFVQNHVNYVHQHQIGLSYLKDSMNIVFSNNLEIANSFSMRRELKIVKLKLR